MLVSSWVILVRHTLSQKFMIEGIIHSSLRPYICISNYPTYPDVGLGCYNTSMSRILGFLFVSFGQLKILRVDWRVEEALPV